MNVRYPVWFLGAAALLAAFSISAQPVPDKRLNEIYAMPPEQVAATSAWIRSRSERLLAHIQSIKDPKIRELVLDMVNNPRSTVFNAAADKNAFWLGRQRGTERGARRGGQARGRARAQGRSRQANGRVVDDRLFGWILVVLALHRGPVCA